MEVGRVARWMKAHRWWVTLILLIVAGYSIGKDRALRDNGQDVAATIGTSSDA